MISLCMEEFESCCNLTITQKKRARCLLRVIGDGKSDRRKRRKCREEVKLLVGSEVWEDAKQKMRRVQTEQARSTTEEQKKKKRLRKKQTIVNDDESAADNDPDLVENTAVNPVTVDTAALTVADAAGVIHHVFPRRVFEANEALKPEGSRKRLCPCCGYPSGCCCNKCINKECSYIYKMPKNDHDLPASHAFRPNLDRIESQVEQKYQKDVRRIKKAYLDRVPVDRLQSTSFTYTTPCKILDHYSFAATTSTDFLHCLLASVLQAVLQDPHGLSPEFAKMDDGQKTRAVWFRQAIQVEIKKGIPHCHSNHPDKFEDDQTVYGIIVPSTYAAVRAIVAAKGSTPMHYSMINIPTNGLKCVKLN